jgi:mono/diheme cytochrome c family protein
MQWPPLKILPLIASLLALLFLTSAAQAQDPIRHGRALLKEYCAGCHAISKTGKSRHQNAPPFRTLGRSFDLDQFPRRLERGISSDHPDMPEFKFSEDDARAAGAYLRAIQQ